LLNIIAGGKRAEILRTENMGTVERIWDVSPYPRKSECYIVLADIAAVTMAAATQEIKNVKFLRDQDVPIIWYYTQCSIADQGAILEKVVLPHAHKELEIKTVRVLWIPKSGIVAHQIFERDILEVAHTYQAAKEYAEKNGIVVEMGFGRSWLPLGRAWHDEALKIERMNLALDALSYFWLRCRAVDLTVLTMHPMENKGEKNVVMIQGLEKHYLVQAEYRYPTEGGHALGWFGGRKGREIVRKVMIRFHLEPDWEQMEKATHRYFHINHPRRFWDGRMRPMPEPERGLAKPHEVFKERRKATRMFLAGKTDSDALPNTFLGTYLWRTLNIQSTIPEHATDKMEEYTLKPTNRILSLTILETPPVEKLESHDDVGGRPAKRGRREVGRERGRTVEPTITITRRISVFNRIGLPRKRHSSEADTSRGQQGRDETDLTKETSISRKPTTPQETANRSKSDEDDEVMVLDPWDVPPVDLSQTDTDTEEDESAIQALVEEAAAKVRSKYLEDKKARKEKRELEKKKKV